MPRTGLAVVCGTELAVLGLAAHFGGIDALDTTLEHFFSCGAGWMVMH